MKFVAAVASALVGVAFATLICWGSLYAFGTFVLHGRGSLFDTNPEIADAFFAGWGGLSAIFAIVSVSIVTRRKSR
jgi:hypothetical protein